jgi:hypothetical protein
VAGPKDLFCDNFRLLQHLILFRKVYIVVTNLNLRFSYSQFSKYVCFETLPFRKVWGGHESRHRFSPSPCATPLFGSQRFPFHRIPCGPRDCPHSPSPMGSFGLPKIPHPWDPLWCPRVPLPWDPLGSPKVPPDQIVK